jgi:hypothetical protein
MSMVDMEMAWQNAESMRDAYCRKKYDPTRGGGQKMSKGNLYCPVFREHYHELFFLDLDWNKVVKSTSVAVDCAGAGASCSGTGGVGTNSSRANATNIEAGTKRLRQAGGDE